MDDKRFAECCEGREVHEDLLRLVKETLPEEEKLLDIKGIFVIFPSLFPGFTISEF